MFAGFGAKLVQINFDHFSGDRVVGPALFNQRHEQRTGLLDCAQAEGLTGGSVGVTVDGGVGGDDQHVAGFGGGAGSRGTGLDDAEDWNGDRILNGVEGKGAGGVAGDDKEFGTLLADQELRALGGVAGDGAARLGAVGQAGSVADKGEARLRHAVDEGAEDGESAEARVENADGGRHSFQIAGLADGRKVPRLTDDEHKSRKTLLEYGLLVPFFLRIELSALSTRP